MDVYASEAEQLELMRRWWKNYGPMTLIAVIIVIVASLGWRYWDQRQERVLEKASMLYERMLNAAANNDDKMMRFHVKRLADHYRHTPYAQLAALIMAREAVYDGELAVAENKLTWVMKHGDSKSLRQLARIRVARVLLAENKLEEALAMLQTVESEAYLPSIKEVTGDILLAMGKPDEARNAYRDALNASPGVDVMQPLLQMKLDNLTQV